jgi:hypothetical protein
MASAGEVAALPIEEPAMWGDPVFVRRRLGQGTFRVLVTDNYQRRCAVTGEKALPVLDAAHIRPVTEGGQHRLDNGLLLRSDVHRLFDTGYVTVTPDGRFSSAAASRTTSTTASPTCPSTGRGSGCPGKLGASRIGRGWSGTGIRCFWGEGI